MKKLILSLAVMFGGFSAVQACAPIVQAVSVPVTAQFVAPIVTSQIVTPVISHTLVAPVSFPVVSAFSTHAVVSPFVVGHRSDVVLGNRAAFVTPRVAVTRTRSITRIR